MPNEASYYKQLDKHVESADEAATLPLVVLGEPGKEETPCNVLLLKTKKLNQTHLTFY